MRIAITGASGNLGSALVRRLARDDHDLVGISRRAPETVIANIEWVTADLTEDSSARVLQEAFAGADAVVHLAWGFQPSHDLAHLEELGVGGTRRVLDAVTAASVPHLVHMSSLGAYSPKRDDQPVDENWPRDGVPSSPYSQHKAAQPPVTTNDIAEVLGARPVHVPARLVRAAMAGAWHARLQQVDPGWLDLGFASPLLDSSRAARELGWSPSADGVSVFREIVAGMRDSASGDTPVLRPRSVAGAVRDAVRRGPVSRRHQP